MTKEKSASLLLRIGLSFVFFYAAVAAFLDPFSWSGFFPDWLKTPSRDGLLLPVYSVAEIVLALWLLSDWKIFYASILAALTVGGIIILNIGSMDIVFRDVAIFFAALALAALEKTSFDDHR